MSLSNYLEVKMLGHAFGRVPFSPPATLYLAALTALPDDFGGGSEPTAADYARLALSNDEFSWSAPASGLGPTMVSNINTLAWNTAVDSWGSIIGLAIYDAPTGGNLLCYTSAPAQTVGSGQELRISAGYMSVTLD